MKLFGRAFYVFILSLGIFGIQSCSSSGSSPSLDGVDEIPSLDAADYDYSLEAAGSAVEGLLLQDRFQTSGLGDFSRAACEGYQLKREMFRDAREIEGFRCYVGTLERKVSAMTVPHDAWAYYEISFPEKAPGEDSGPPPTVRVRVGKFSGTLKMDACVPGQTDGDYIPNVQFRFQASSTGYTGYAINTYQFEDRGSSFTGSSRVDVTIEGTSAEDFTSAEFSSVRHDTNGSGEGWQQRATFTADASTHSNTLQGANANQSTEWGNHTGGMYGIWDDSLEGSVRYATTGQHPAPDETDCLEWYTPPAEFLTEYLTNCIDKCYDKDGVQSDAVDGMCSFEDSGIEGFSIENNDGAPPTFTLIPADENPAFITEVTAADVPELGDPSSETGFTEEWDCTAEGSFAPIDATNIEELSRCENREDINWDLCWLQEEAARAEVEGGGV